MHQVSLGFMRSSHPAQARFPPMSRHVSNRSQRRLVVEPLERRELLSRSAPKFPIVAADAAASAPLSILARLGSKSDPNGNNIVVKPMVVIKGQAAPGIAVRLQQVAGGSLHRATTANAKGEYQFRLALPVGQ